MRNHTPDGELMDGVYRWTDQATKYPCKSWVEFKIGNVTCIGIMITLPEGHPGIERYDFGETCAVRRYVFNSTTKSGPQIDLVTAVAGDACKQLFRRAFE